MKMYRHGDIWIKEVKKEKKLVGEAKEDNKVTLALGEATGHSHNLSVPPGALITFWGEVGDVTGFSLPTEGTLIHNEHKMLKIEPGDYEIIREREYDYFDNEIKQVAD